MSIPATIEGSPIRAHGSRLLHLPPELQAIIYNDVLGGETICLRNILLESFPDGQDVTRSIWVAYCPSSTISISLLLICRATTVQAHTILYAKNTLCFSEYEAMEVWANIQRRLNAKHNLQAVRHLHLDRKFLDVEWRVYYYEDRSHSRHAVCSESCPNVTTLSIVLPPQEWAHSLAFDSLADNKVDWVEWEKVLEGFRPLPLRNVTISLVERLPYLNQYRQVMDQRARLNQAVMKIGITAKKAWAERMTRMLLKQDASADDEDQAT